MITLTPASIWILLKFAELKKRLDLNHQKYELAHSVEALYKFLWDDYADWYVEYLKTDESQIPFAKELFREYVILLSPFAPFETEVLWEKFFGKTELLAFEMVDEKWLASYLKNVNFKSASKFETQKEFITNIRSLRGLFGLDPATKVRLFTDTTDIIEASEFVSRLGKLELVERFEKPVFKVEKPGFSYEIDIFEYLTDKDKEVQRTEKLIQSLTKQIQALESQLADERFLRNAEEVVILEKKEQLEARKLELNEQNSKLNYIHNSI